MSSHDNHQPDQYGQSARVRLSSPTDILDIVPALIGFYPTESLCALYLDDVPAGRTLALTARADLPTTPDELTGLLAHTADMLTRYPTAILVAYAADQEQARDTVRQVAQRFGPDRIVTGIIAAPQGWTTVDPLHPAASNGPTPTRPGPDRPPQPSPPRASTPWAPATTSATASPPPTHRPTADYDRAAAEQALPHQPTDDQLEQMAAEVREFIGNYLAQPLTVTVDDAAFLAGRVRFGVPRDAALREIDRTQAQSHATLWQGVAAMTPDDCAAPVLGLLGIAAWVAGNGALANLALERAHAYGYLTDHGLLGIAHHVLDNAVPPAAWDQLKDGM